MWVGVSERSFKAIAAKHDHETMPLAGLDNHLCILNFLDFLCQQTTELFANRSIDASGSAICDDPLPVQGAKICAGRYIARLQFQSQPERLDHPPPDLKLNGVIAEQRE